MKDNYKPRGAVGLEMNPTYGGKRCCPSLGPLIGKKFAFILTD